MVGGFTFHAENAFGLSRAYYYCFIALRLGAQNAFLEQYSKASKAMAPKSLHGIFYVSVLIDLLVFLNVWKSEYRGSPYSADFPFHIYISLLGNKTFISKSKRKTT
jgi:hypothetical protein